MVSVHDFKIILSVTVGVQVNHRPNAEYRLVKKLQYLEVKNFALMISLIFITILYNFPRHHKIGKFQQF